MKFEWKRLLPKYWYQNSPTDWDWDATLNDILDNAKNIEVSAFTTTIDGVPIWTSNWPNAYGAFYHHGSIEGVPSIKTRHRLRKLVEAGQKKRLQDIVEKLRNTENRS